jgi:signal recognition particle subunit SEC65
VIDEDWKLLTSFFPADWRDLAVSTNALKGLRKDKSEETLLRTLLIHLAGGFSLRETVVRARQAELADLSDVAFLKRLRKSGEWLHQMCLAMFAERGLELDKTEHFCCRLLDATDVREPGKTGSLWRIHYSVQVPSLCCDFFKLTATEGDGTGESFTQFPIQAGDYLVADRGYSQMSGMRYVHLKGAYFMVRINTATVLLFDENGKRFPLLRSVEGVKDAGAIKWWPAAFDEKEDGGRRIPGRICVVRKTEEAIRTAQKKLKRNANKKQKTLKPETLEYAKYVILFTTFPEKEFSTAGVLEWYRIRWQIELVFKRFKQIAQLGHLPKHDDESAKAWLYGKLFVALTIEKIVSYAESFSPWGYDMGQLQTKESLA